MKNIILLFVIPFMLLFITADINAQKRNSDFMDKVWYGGSVGLGFFGTGGGSLFSIELSPMAGYKITPKFSAGPRIIFDYAHYRTRVLGNVEKFNLYSLGLGVLSRFKIINVIFIHGEANFIRIQDVYSTPMGLKKISDIEPHLLLGLGYDSGVGEIMILWDFMTPDNSVQSPFELRFGFNINF